MLQQVMTAPGVIQFREVPTPQPQPGQVLVKIVKIGVCGSDIHVYHGEHPFTKYPITQGHEVSGEIAALGEGVTGFTVGQKVTIQPQVVCGKCWPCRHGKYNLCEELKVMGFQTTGVASHYFAVDAKKVTPLQGYLRAGGGPHRHFGGPSGQGPGGPEGDGHRCERHPPGKGQGVRRGRVCQHP